MTTLDGNPLTGDPDSPEVRHLLAQLAPARHDATRRGGPDDCDTDWCTGCSAAACVSRGGGSLGHAGRGESGSASLYRAEARHSGPLAVDRTPTNAGQERP